MSCPLGLRAKGAAMTPQTLKAIKAILETDTTLSDPQKTLILRACRKPEGVAAQIREPELKYLTARRAADILSTSVRTVWRLAKTGQLKPVKIAGCTRFRLEDIARMGAEVPEG